MTVNREVFARNPLTMSIPNDGVAKVVEPRTDDEWEVLRFELQTFVCAGEYERGIDRILGTYLDNLGKPTQPAVWVSGFYGSGKSHLVRVLEYLWRDTTLKDGASARDLAELPADIRARLRELTNVSRRYGGVWSAAGTLGASTSESVRLALLAILFRSAGLPAQYPQARFLMWLKHEGMYDAFVAEIAKTGRDLASELNALYVSPVVAKSLLAVYPQFAADERQARTTLQAQFPSKRDISNDEMLDALTEVLRLNSTDPAKLPCTLIVLDELQQFIGESDERSSQVQQAVETVSSQLGSTVLFVATGQSTMQETPQLARIQGRFTVQVPLTSKDVERVVRSVVLRKNEPMMPTLRAALEQCSGEIDKQLNGTRIAPRPEDQAIIAEDYPLLPTRQRFWEQALLAVDRSGVRGQLRSQLRIAFEASRSVAEEPLGTVVGGDFLYDQIKTEMTQSGMLLREEYETIEKEADSTEGGAMRARACAAIYLVNKIATGEGAGIGLRATVDTLADLMTTDLTVGSAPLRKALPPLLDGLVTKGVLLQVNDEYRLQTREGAAWEQEYASRAATYRSDTARITEERTTALRAAIAAELKNVLRFTVGESKTVRTLEVGDGIEPPTVKDGAVPVWVRDEWNAALKMVQEDTRALGTDSPVITVFIPRPDGDHLRGALAGLLAATETLNTKGATVSTEAGRNARDAMESRKRRLAEDVQRTVAAMLREAKVIQGGGNELSGASLAAAVREAADASLLRLYPAFKQADQSGWDRVAKQAQEGSASALERVGYKGEAAEHPVCKLVLDTAGSSGKRGRDIREKFALPPYGWPKDAVDAALIVLVANGALRATQAGSPVDAKDLGPANINATEFRREDEPLTTGQKLAVRRLLQDAGITLPQNADDGALAGLVGTLVADLRSLAASAGGPPPRPLTPDTLHLDALQHRVGNDLLRGVYEERERLKEDRTSWAEMRDAVAKRLPRWETLQRLLHHATALPVAATIQPQVNAIAENRTLLADPDPVPPLAAELADALRDALKDIYSAYEGRFKAERDALFASAEWKQLDPEQRSTLMVSANLHLAEPPSWGTESDILRALGTTSLDAWRDRTAALPGRFAAVRAQAIQLLTPSAVTVILPKSTLTTEADVDAYLDDARERIMAHIRAGKPVVL